MHLTHLKIVNANHAYSINKYKNTKRKLLKLYDNNSYSWYAVLKLHLMMANQ
jgi:hypothetical protein